MNNVKIRQLSSHEATTAAGLLARGMRNNPMHIQALGPDTDVRENALSLMFTPVLRQQVRKGFVLGAFIQRELVGVTGMVPPKSCQLSFSEKIAVLPALV